MMKWFYVEWAKISLWTPKEAAILSVEADPDNTQELMSEYGEKVIVKLDLLLRRIERSMDLGMIEQFNGKLYPHSYLAWALKEKVELPEEMVEAIQENPPSIGKQQKEDASNKRAENNVYKIMASLLYCMDAVDPTHANYLKELRAVSRKLQAQGLDIKDEETILAHLKKAVAINPPQS